MNTSIKNLPSKSGQITKNKTRKARMPSIYQTLQRKVCTIPNKCIFILSLCSTNYMVCKSLMFKSHSFMFNASVDVISKT